VSGPTLAPPRPPDSHADRTTPTRMSRRRRRRTTRIVVIASIGALAAAFLATNIWFRIEQRSTARALDSTEADIAATNLDLAQAVTDLQLVTRQAARTEQATGLAQLDLGRIQGTLAGAQETLAEQGIHVNALTNCLDGITASVQLQGAGNDAAAIDALRAVGGDCNRALVTLGGTGPVYALDFADPFILNTSQGYYGYATNSGGGDVQVIHSNDLSEWDVVGNGLPTLPSWAEPNVTWAPSVLARSSKFVLYYTVREASTDRQCISRGVARNAGGPFVDNSAGPLRCAGDGDIDASPFVDRDGTAYLMWRSSGSPLRITTQQLSAEGLSLVGSPRDLIVADQDWENGTVEGPAMGRIGNRYHLFYSGNEWNGRNYAIGHAVCESPVGPCEKTGNGPIFASTGSIVGPGGQELFVDGFGGVHFAYHAFTEPYVGYPASRRLHVAQVTFDGDRAIITPG
jgi:hypothetical protein